MFRFAQKSVLTIAASFILLGAPHAHAEVANAIPQRISGERTAPRVLISAPRRNTPISSIEESRWRGDNDSTRERVRLPKSES
jgi:hypothetical protein